MGEVRSFSRRISRVLYVSYGLKCRTTREGGGSKTDSASREHHRPHCTEHQLQPIGYHGRYASTDKGNVIVSSLIGHRIIRRLKRAASTYKSPRVWPFAH